MMIVKDKFVNFHELSRIIQIKTNWDSRLKIYQNTEVVIRDNIRFLRYYTSEELKKNEQI